MEFVTYKMQNSLNFLCIIELEFIKLGGIYMIATASLNAQLLAYETIRHNIIHGDLPGGKKLIEERLAEQIGVSRTPIREAIRRLEQEGFIKNKRVYVPTKMDLKQLYEVKSLILCHCVQKAASVMSDDELLTLQHVLIATSESQANTVNDASKQFYETITAACNNRLMITEITKIISLLNMYNVVESVNPRPNFMSEQLEIIQALLTRNAAQAHALMHKHILANCEYILEFKN